MTIDNLVPLPTKRENFKHSSLRFVPEAAGCYVLTTAEGKALVMTLWSDEEAADAGLASGHYSDQVAKFATFFRSPPGRDTYDVGIAEAPLGARSGV